MAKWKEEKAQTFQARVAEEHDRLVKVFAGPLGLDPDAWGRLPRQLEMVAGRNVRRADAMERDRNDADVWAMQPRVRVMVSRMNAALRARKDRWPNGLPMGLRHSNSIPSAAMAGGGGRRSEQALSIAAISTVGRISTREVNRTKEVAQRELASCIVTNLKRHGDLHLEAYEDQLAGPADGDEDGQVIAWEEAAELAMVRDLAVGIKVQESPHAAAKWAQKKASRMSWRTAAAAAMDCAGKDGQEEGDKEAGAEAGEGTQSQPQSPSTGSGCRNTMSGSGTGMGLALDNSHSIGNRIGTLSSRDGAVRDSNQGAHSVMSVSAAGQQGSLRMRSSGMRSSMTKLMGGLSLLGSSGSRGSSRRAPSAIRAARWTQMQLSPLVQSYMDACRAAGHPHSQQIADQLGISESSGTLTLEGAALPDGAATNLAAVLPVCTHLKALVLARTVLNLGAVAALLPVARTLRLTRVELGAADMPPEAWQHLVDALTRPTLSLVHPPTEWWMSLKELSLAGNPLGDRGLAALCSALCGLVNLTTLSLSQTALTEWSAPQVGALVRAPGLAKLCSLDLSQNQLGPQACVSLAAALPAATALTRLNLGWNPAGSGVQHLAWAMLGPRTAPGCRVSDLGLSGCDLESEDYMALAALLKLRGPSGVLKKLDLSHNSLLGVSAQCMLRQLDALLPPLPPMARASAAAARLQGLAGMAGKGRAGGDMELQKGLAGAAAMAVTAPIPGVPKLQLAQVAGLAASAASNAVPQRPHTTGGAVKQAGSPGMVASAARATASSVGGSHRGLDPMAPQPPQLSQRAGTRTEGGASGREGQGYVNLGSVAGRSALQSSVRTSPNASHDAAPSPTNAAAAEAAAFAAARREAVEKSIQVNTLGCRVELDGGAAPTPRQRVGAGGAPSMPPPGSNTTSTPGYMSARQIPPAAENPHSATPAFESEVGAVLSRAWPTGTPRDPVTHRQRKLLAWQPASCKAGGQEGGSEGQQVMSSMGDFGSQLPSQQPQQQLPSQQPQQQLPSQQTQQQPQGSAPQDGSTTTSPSMSPQPLPRAPSNVHTMRFVLDLSKARPDHLVAQMLVEHELAGRQAKITPPVWRNMVLDGKVIRKDGQDVVPFDVLYEGWAHPAVLPQTGVLELEVACLPQHASPWLKNSRLHFNAARLLAEHTPQ